MSTTAALIVFGTIFLIYICIFYRRGKEDGYAKGYAAAVERMKYPPKEPTLLEQVDAHHAAVAEFAARFEKQNAGWLKEAREREQQK